jgi:hypothetical protein
MTEKYQPSQEKIKKAEGMMTRKQKEMRSIREHNFKFIDQFSNFGLENQKMIDKLMQYGKISDIQLADDSLAISYKTGKHDKIIVRKSKVKKIDPQTNQVVSTSIVFQIDVNPEKNYIKITGGKKPSGEQYEQDSGMWG